MNKELFIRSTQIQEQKAAWRMQSEPECKLLDSDAYLWPLCESKIVARRRLRWPLAPRVMCTRTIFANLIIRVDNSSQSQQIHTSSNQVKTF
jgi:hypothetical protein